MIQYSLKLFFRHLPNLFWHTIKNYVIMFYLFVFLKGKKPIICLSRIINEYKLDEKPPIAIVLTLTIGRKPRWLKDREVKKKMWKKCREVWCATIPTFCFYQSDSSGTSNISSTFALKQKKNSITCIVVIVIYTTILDIYIR